MNSELKAQLAQLGPVRDITPGTCGSPAEVVLRPEANRSKVRVVTAIRTLIDCGLTALKAKRTIEAALDTGLIAVRLPAVISLAATTATLREAGVHLTKLAADDAVDVAELRAHLGLTQDQFALRFNLPLATVQHWEQGRDLDRAAKNLLRAIRANPAVVAAAQEQSA